MNTSNHCGNQVITVVKEKSVYKNCILLTLRVNITRGLIADDCRYDFDMHRLK